MSRRTLASTALCTTLALIPLTGCDDTGDLEFEELTERGLPTSFRFNIASWDQFYQDLRLNPRDLDDAEDRCGPAEFVLNYSNAVVPLDADVYRSNSSSCAQSYNFTHSFGTNLNRVKSLKLLTQARIDTMMDGVSSIQNIKLRSQGGSAYDCDTNFYEGSYGERHRLTVEFLVRLDSGAYTTRSAWVTNSAAPEVDLYWTDCELATVDPEFPNSEPKGPIGG